LGRLGGGGIDEEALRETLDLMTAGRTQARKRPAERPPEELREPLTTLGLDWPTTLDQVKARYKTLAKRHHPDANGGDRAAEERLKVINLAYAALRTRLSADLRPAAAG
jgi:DnaJ-domain-containing protein 1